MKKYGHVVEFYGETCPHCLSMRPVIEQIESETGVKFEKLEVWNNSKNAEKMKDYYDIIGEACGGLPGVPSFVNLDTNQALCGVHDKEDLIHLLEGGDCKDNVCKPHSKNP